MELSLKLLQSATLRAVLMVCSMSVLPSARMSSGKVAVGYTVLSYCDHSFSQKALLSGENVRTFSVFGVDHEEGVGTRPILATHTAKNGKTSSINQ